MEKPPILRLLDPYWISLAFTAVVQFALFVRWLYRRVRSDELNRAFVHDMATNHLPHIYELLLKLCEKQGIEAEAQPPIRWVELNGNDKR
jgi:Fe2+ transport system protein B